MKELSELLGQLAVKLGTTVEKLWEVLLRQAPISGTISLVLCIGLVLFTVWVFKFVKGKTTKHEAVDGKYTYKEAEWADEGAVFSWIFVGIVLVFTVTCVILETEHIVTAFLNPEYWALEEILSKLK